MTFNILLLYFGPYCVIQGNDLNKLKYFTKVVGYQPVFHVVGFYICFEYQNYMFAYTMSFIMLSLGALLALCPKLNCCHKR